MESNGKNSLNDGTNGKVGTKGSTLWVCELVFRLVCVATTLAAAVVMGDAKETEQVPLQLTPSLPAVLYPVTAKSSYSSAFVYFIIANAIACGYSIISLGGAIANRGRRGKLAMLIFIIDELMLALLFSGNGAAAAIGNVGENGNSHVGWNKICNVFTKFCSHVKISVILSLVGALNYVFLALISIISLHKKDT
ncbi:Casparian strip membrane protein [Dioscorea alata]|uniref:Casparian strip membrane protein n=1 Tax=Dioscorea alata TaxID=55571 RepID=A0ACB7VQY1_DIOAL|nr:Casparian strip membrane protein [Dioscorea alata]